MARQHASGSADDIDHPSYHSDAVPPGLSIQTDPSDPDQASTQVVFPIHRVVDRLDALLMVLKTCKASACTHPWKVLHPTGDVTSLKEALHPDFDEFYEVQQQRVKFDKCEKGYILESEGPVDVRPYLEGIGG